MNKLQPIIFETLKGYDKKQFASDLIAGVIVAIIALPLSIALALASGVGPEQGIYTAIIFAIHDYVLYLLISKRQLGIFKTYLFKTCYELLLHSTQLFTTIC